MIVLHGLWHSEYQLCAWAESSEAPLHVPRSSRSRKPAAHPFAIDAANLATTLVSSGVATEATPAGAVTLTLLLPSTRRGPLPSPFLLRDDALASDAPAHLLPWAVPALVLDARAAADVLRALWDVSSDQNAIARDVAIADDFRFLGELAKLALTQVALGGVLPLLERANGGFVARWRPATVGATATQLRELRGAMPPALRAAEPDRVPSDVVSTAHEQLVDALARWSITEEKAYRAAQGVEPSNGKNTGGQTSRRRQSKPLGRRARAGRLAAAEAWPAALASQVAVVQAPPAAAEAAAAVIDPWIRPLHEATTRAFRLCFRLEPPVLEADEEQDRDVESWRLEFLLQATDDPTLIVPAAEVWRTRGRMLSRAGRRLEDPQERLLEDLGRALRLFEPLATALREPAPTALLLDARGAYEFLRQSAAALEQAGFGLLVPSWWGTRGARLGLKLRARPTTSSSSRTSADGLLGTETIVAYDWQIAVGDATLSPAEFRRLAKLKQPLVRVRGRWVELRAGDVDAVLELLARDTRETLTVADVLRAQAGAAPAAAGVAVVAVAAEGWLGELLANAENDRAHTADAPKTLRAELRPYQRRGLGWLGFLDRLGLGACLADDMGLGKTIQLLALLLAEREAAGPRKKQGPARKNATARDGEAGSVLGPTLLVCPMSVVGNWQREAARFAPSLRVHVHHGGERLSGDEFARVAADSDLVLTTYALAARDRDALAGVSWWRVALDEAQNIKNSATRQAQALRSLRAARRVALTGTPVENRLVELWSIFDFLNPGLLGSQRSFRELFATPIERYGDDERAAALRRISTPFILRRLKTDRSIIQDLPDKIEMKEYCNLTREQATLYQAVVDEMLAKIASSEGMERRGLVLATMLRLKQVCNHPAHLMSDGSALAGRSGKLERLEVVLEEAVATGERALVFTQFAEWGLRLRTHLQQRLGREIAFLHGGTSKRERDHLVQRFQAGEGAPVLLLSLKAGGTGLNLTAANHVVHFDRWWNPAVEEQASDRAFRIGQTRNVQVRKFICAGTLEERIDEMIEHKKALAQRIVGSGEAWLTELSTEELRRVVALSYDAVAE